MGLSDGGRGYWFGQCLGIWWKIGGIKCIRFDQIGV